MVDESIEGLPRRVHRAAELLAEEIAAIIVSELLDPRIRFTTVTRVVPSGDLRSARVYLSVYADETARRQTLRAVEHARGYIQSLLSQRLRMKFTPRLFFVLDHSVEHSDRVSRILRELNAEESAGDAV